MSRDVVSDEAWAVISSLFPPVKATGRPPVDRRRVVEATVWRYRTGAPGRNLTERFGNWNTLYKNFDRRAKAGSGGDAADAGVLPAQVLRRGFGSVCRSWSARADSICTIQSLHNRVMK